MLKRSILYVGRNLTRTLLLFLIFLLVSTFSLSGLAVMGASEDTSAELRGTTGASFRIERNLATGGSSAQNNGMSYNTQEYVTDEMIEKIGEVDGIKAYTAQENSNLSLHDGNDEAMELIKTSSKWDSVGLNYISTAVGSFFSEYDTLFLSVKFELTQGRHITADDKQKIIISEDLAEKHDLNVGDKLYLYRDNWTTGTVNAGDDKKEVEIIGLFKIIEQQADRDSTAPSDLYENYVFVDMKTSKELGNWVEFEPERTGYETADFYVDDPAGLETIILNVQKINSIDWNNFNVTVNDEVYQRSASSMSNVENLIRILIICVVVISIGIVTMILTMWIKGRMRETGILMAVGISKASIVGQHIVEVGVIAVVAFLTTWFITPAVAKVSGSLFNSNILQETIIVTEGNYIAVCGIGIVLLLLAILISSFPIMRMKPREILSRMD